MLGAYGGSDTWLWDPSRTVISILASVEESLKTCLDENSH
jgi:hypothetical protein